MRDFAYARAGTAESAAGALADPRTSVIAGGTELLNWFRLGIAAADRVVDIGGLDELRGIAMDGDDLRVGALATLNEIGEHPLVTRTAGALASACLQAASAQIRNRATIGGNVLQRTRCPYFRARISAPRNRCPGRATSAIPAAAAPRWPAGTSARPSSAGPRTAWPYSPPIRRSPWPCSTRRLTCSARPGRGRSRCGSST